MDLRLLETPTERRARGHPRAGLRHTSALRLRSLPGRFTLSRVAEQFGIHRQTAASQIRTWFINGMIAPFENTKNGIWYERVYAKTDKGANIQPEDFECNRSGPSRGQVRLEYLAALAQFGTEKFIARNAAEAWDVSLETAHNRLKRLADFGYIERVGKWSVRGVSNVYWRVREKAI